MLLLLCNGTAIAQSDKKSREVNLCGAIEKANKKVSKSYKGEVYLDRFGNEYTNEEVSIGRFSAQPRSATANNCSGGRFNLIFTNMPNTPAFTVEECTTICNVFQYLTLQLGLTPAGNGLVQIPISVKKGPANVVGGLGSGSEFYQRRCGLTKSMVWERLRLNTNNVPGVQPNTFAGLLMISDIPQNGTTWNTLPNGPVGANEYDLYSVALHEALHILGFASLIGLNGSGDMGTYSNWDRFLVGPSSTTPLLNATPTTSCCDAHSFNSTPYPMPASFGPVGCNSRARFFSNGTAIAPVNSAGLNASNDNDMRNKLSHLDRTCPGANGANFVMHPGIAAGEIRRMITSQELQILCALGYNTVGGCGQNCTVMANDDTAPIITISQGATLTLPFATLLLNDVVPPGTASSAALVSGCGTTTGPGPNNTTVTIMTVVQNNGSVTITGQNPGIATFCYSITSPSSCGGATQCDQAVVTVIIRQNPISATCPPSTTPGCNLVCFGDFERFIPQITSIGAYNSQLGLTPSFIVSGNLNNDNSVDIVSNATTNSINLRWIHFPQGQGGGECFRIPLGGPIKPGCTATISFDAVAYPVGVGTAIQNAVPTIGFYGINGAPLCANTSPNTILEPVCDNSGNFDLCTGINSPKAYCMTNQIPGNINTTRGMPVLYSTIIGSFNQPMAPHSFSWMNNTTTDIDNILVFGHFKDANSSQNYSYQMDNLRVTASCAGQVVVTPTILSQCINGQARIQYNVCLKPSTTAPVTLNLNAIVPQVIGGIAIVPGGGFNASGAATVTFNPTAPNVQICQTITLTMNIGNSYVPNSTVPITLNYTIGGNCATVPTDLILQTCTVDPQVCFCTPTNSFTVGSNQSSITNLSTSGVPANLTNGCLSVNGRLIVNSNFNINTCQVIMQTGASIEVTGTNTLTLTNSLVEGCRTLWNTILVRDQATLTATGNRINDALYAIRAENSARLNLQNNIFDRNFIGVYTPPTGTPHNIIQPTAMVSNRFLGTLPLKPNFSGAPQNSGQFGFAGVCIYDATLIIGSQHRFEGLRNGVVATRSFMRLNNSRIRNLVTGPATGGFPFDQNRYGILAEAAVTTQAEFDTIQNVRIGVYARLGNFRASNSVITASEPNGQGINVQQGTTSTEISSCTIRATAEAMRIEQRTSTNSFQNFISGNQISTLLNSAGAGIYLGSCTGFQVTSNTVQRDLANSANYIGLLLVSSSNNNVVSNNFTNLNQQGIWIQGGSGNFFRQNSVTGVASTVTPPFTAQQGFEVANSTNTYCLNTVERVNSFGVRFDGTCSPSTFRINLLGNSFSGLWLTNTATISNQVNQGNRWAGSNYTSGNGAFHQSSDQLTILSSQFLTQNLTPLIRPSWSTGGGTIIPWFTNLTNGDPTPATVVSNCPPVPLSSQAARMQFASQTGSEDAVAAVGGYKMGEITDAYNWMAQQNLYERLRRRSDEAVDSDKLLKAFKDKAKDETLGLLSDVKASRDFLLERSDAVQYELEQQSLLINRFSSRSTVEPSLYKAIEQYREMTEAVEADRVKEAAEMRKRNTGIKGNAIFERNEQETNDMVLENNLWNTRTVKDNVLRKIQAIADQCPNTGGFAVYEARVWYRMFQPDVPMWNDEKLCARAGQRSEEPLRRELAPSYLLRPNPANDEVFLVTTTPVIMDQIVEVYNAVGQLVQSLRITAGQDILRIGTADWQNGLYFYRVREAGKLLQFGNFNVHH